MVRSWTTVHSTFTRRRSDVPLGSVGTCRGGSSVPGHQGGRGFVVAEIVIEILVGALTAALAALIVNVAKRAGARALGVAAAR